MSEVLEFLSNNAAVTTFLAAVLGFLLLSIVAMYIAAFFQGREVHFWPPKLGPRLQPEEAPDAAEDPLTAIDSRSSAGSSSEQIGSFRWTSRTGDLGKGVRIGGSYKEQQLSVVASDWGRFRDSGWVKSGWLYSSPVSGNSHAIAFFKVHLDEAGTGYIHILDASNPEHTIWFETDTGFRQEGPFCWSSVPTIKKTDLWKFRWKS